MSVKVLHHPGQLDDGDLQAHQNQSRFPSNPVSFSMSVSY